MANSQRRMVYSKIWTSQQFGRLSPRARLLFIGMITLADDDGRLVGEAAYLRGQIFPYDDITADAMKALKKEVVDMRLIEAYSVDNFDYLQHPKWQEYQIIRGDLYKRSSLPSRNGSVTSTLRKRSLSKDKISKDKIRQEKSATFEEFWKLYPNRKDKKNAQRSWERLLYEKQLSALNDLPTRVQSESWKKDGGKYIPLPTTYLNGERWQDEIISTSGKVDKF